MDDLNKSADPESPLEEISEWVEEHSDSLLINNYPKITNDK